MANQPPRLQNITLLRQEVLSDLGSLGKLRPVHGAVLTCTDNITKSPHAHITDHCTPSLVYTLI